MYLKAEHISSTSSVICAVHINTCEFVCILCPHWLTGKEKLVWSQERLKIYLWGRIFQRIGYCKHRIVSAGVPGKLWVWAICWLTTSWEHRKNIFLGISAVCKWSTRLEKVCQLGLSDPTWQTSGSKMTSSTAKALRGCGAVENMWRSQSWSPALVMTIPRSTTTNEWTFCCQENKAIDTTGEDDRFWLWRNNQWLTVYFIFTVVALL